MNSKTLFGFIGGVVVALGLSFAISRRTGEANVDQPAAAASRSSAEYARPSDPPEAPESQITPPTPAMTPAPAPRPRTSVSSIVQPRSAKPPLAAHAGRDAVLRELSLPPTTTATQPPEPAPVAVAPELAPVPQPAPAPVTEARVFRPDPFPPVRQPVRAPSTVTIRQGTTLSIRLGEGLSSDRNRSGDEFTGALDQPLVVDDLVIAERGARVEGRVVESQIAGRVKGLSRLSIELTRLHTADGQNIQIRTAAYAQDGPTSKKDDAVKVGAGAAIGAIIGAIAGGGKGAAVGAGVGGAAGGGTVAATRGKPVVIPVETHLTFRLEQPVTITERLRN